MFLEIRFVATESCTCRYMERWEGREMAEVEVLLEETAELVDDSQPKNPTYYRCFFDALVEDQFSKNMSFSWLSRVARFWTKSPLHQESHLCRPLLDAAGSKYSSSVGTSKRNIYGQPLGFEYRGLMSKHGREMRNYGLVNSLYINVSRKYSTHATTEKKSKKMLLYLTGLVFAMVGCSYASVPLYRRFCQATGYGGTVQRRESVEEKNCSSCEGWYCHIQGDCCAVQC